MSIKRARELRKSMSPAEARLWNYLRSLKPEGFHFRRQVPLGNYYADFACHHAKLVIEVDGDTHFTPGGIRHDLERDRFIRSQGFEIARYTNAEVMQNLDGVATHLLNRLAALPLRPGSKDQNQSPPELFQ